VVHRGDCLEVLPTLSPKSIDLVYCGFPPNKFVLGDFNDWVRRLVVQITRVIKPSGVIVLLPVEKITFCFLELLFQELGLRSRPHIWVKWQNAPPGGVNRGPLDMFQHISVAYRKTASYHRYAARLPGRPYKGFVTTTGAKCGELSGGLPSIHNINEGFREHRNWVAFPVVRRNKMMKREQATQPTDMAEYFIRLYSPDGGTVVDPCCGSGTTGIAAVRAGRNFTGIEVDSSRAEWATFAISKEMNRPQDIENNRLKLIDRMQDYRKKLSI
jgi:site-specific DNA-methyltransferase (adenine-specific)